ncbi:MAG TPA: transketolase [Longimicrobiales bacterium]|nr:transketolase [Longimicrobiales bacterium]
MPDLDRLAIDTLRVLSMDAVQQANSGHPGTPMALAPVGYVTWTRHLKHNPRNPQWIDRDRFVLSAGHASMLLYGLLYLTGYELSLEDIKNFRQWGSPTAGHPEYGHAPGVETTTGPLGQGVANSVGMAMAERWLANRFNRPNHTIIDHHTIVLCSDGDLMEGISHEAAALAGHQKLGKLIWVFDDNSITIEGSTDLATSTDQVARFEAYGWHTLRVDDGNDLQALDEALDAAKAETERPTFINLRTTIAWGAPTKAGTADAHGAPLGDEEIRQTKEHYGYPSQEPFFVPDEALAHWRAAAERGAEAEAEWRERFDAYRTAFPDEAAELERVASGALPEGWAGAIPDLLDVAKEATRASSGKALNGAAAALPELVGGSADLGGSNKTDISGADSLLASTPGGRVVHFGIREHAMGAIMNGMALHGGLRPFGGTFLIFSDYMRPAIRLASLMRLPVTYVFTHDSIGLGEDGPTHQPIEQLMSLRLIPGLVDLRPGDPAETAVAWRVALERGDAPAFLALTRQGLPNLRDQPSHANADGLGRGAYVLAEAEGGEPRVVLLASGSEVHVAVEARSHLQADGIPTRVVSFPSWALFQEQDPEYQRSVLGSDGVVRVSVEAGVTRGWERWIGPRGRAVGIDHFGASAPAETLFEKFGITAEAVAVAAREALQA